MARYGDFSVDLSGALDAAQALSTVPGKILQAQKRAVGTLKRRLVPEASRDIRREYNIKATTARQRLHISQRRDGIVLTGKATGVSLMAFNARQNRKGVSYSILRGQRVVRAHAFIRKTRSGKGPFVWIRREGHDRRTNQTRTINVWGGTGRGSYQVLAGSNSAYSDQHGYPIFQQFGPSVGQMLKHGRRPERLAEFALRILQSEQKRLLGTT
jgi:hypothetical protein